ARHVVGRIDTDLAKHRHDGRLDRRLRPRAGRPRLMASRRSAPEEVLRHHAAPAVSDADEEDLAQAALRALMIAPCIPSATSCVNSTLTSSKPTSSSPETYSPRASAPAMQPT